LPGIAKPHFSEEILTSAIIPKETPAMSDAPRLKINEVVTAKDVQEELARATGQSEWTELKFWKFFRVRFVNQKLK